jgi:predicted Zn finger-like uncharacterized protein
MDIRCERCLTEYEFDAEALPEAGLPVKCTQCGHVFRVRRGMGTLPLPQVTLRRAGTVIAVAPDLTTVGQWITERRLLADDEFSLAGSPFRRLADAADFSRLFPPKPGSLAAAARPAEGDTQRVADPYAGEGAAPGETLQFRVPAELADAARRAIGAPPVTPSRVPVMAPPAPAAVQVPRAEPTAMVPSTTVQVPSPLLPESAAVAPAPTVLENAPIAPVQPVARVDDSADEGPRLRVPVRAVDPLPSFVPVPEVPAAPFPATLDPSEDLVRTSEGPLLKLPPGTASDQWSSRTDPGSPVGRAQAVTDQAYVEVTPPAFDPSQQVTDPPMARAEEPSRPAPSSSLAQTAVGYEAPVAPQGFSAPEDEDPALAQYLAGRRSTTRRNLLVGVVLLGAAGAGAWFFLGRQAAPSGPPAAATSAFEASLADYQSGDPARFGAALESLQRALSAAGEAPYGEAQARLASLHAAWAESLRLSEKIQLAQAKARAGQPDAEAAAADAKSSAADAVRHEEAGCNASVAALQASPEAAFAHRARFDCLASTGKLDQARTHVERFASDEETESRAFAAWAATLATDDAAAGTARLADFVTSGAPFARAGLWLALARERQGDVAGASEAMRKFAAAAPGHSGAQLWLSNATAEAKKPDAAAKAVEPAKAVVPAAAPAKPEPPAPSAAKPPAPPAPPVAPPKPPPPPAPPAVAKAPAAPPAAPVPPAAPKGPVDTDKLMDQANSLLINAASGKKGVELSRKALALCEQIIAVKPNHAEALYGKGVALLNLERLDDGIVALKQALAVNPRLSDAMFVLADAYRSKGQTKEALVWYRKYIDVMPTGPDASAARTMIQTLEGR